LKSTSIDADLLEDIAVARNGTRGMITAFERVRGLESSFWEHAVFEPSGIVERNPGVSTVRALQSANKFGIQVFNVNTGNLSVVDTLLELSQDVKDAVKDAVNSGLEVTIPARNVQLGTWTGVGYIVENPLTGAGAYQITGGLSGGFIEIVWAVVHGRSPQTGLGPGNRPSAILAVGAPWGLIANQGGVFRWPGLLAVFLDRAFGMDDWGVAEQLGGTLHAMGYNVYIQEVTGRSIGDFVNGTGNKTPNDLFYFIGHGCNGSLTVPLSEDNPNTETDESEIPVDVGPGIFRRGPGSTPGGFKVAFLTACATGGSCSSCEGENPVCTESTQKQKDWANALLGPEPTGGYVGQAVVGHIQLVPARAAASEARIFWNELSSGSPVGSAAQGVTAQYLTGDAKTTLPPVP
jgi:hypothetical protein